jgi:hypothetical protein
MKRTVITTTPRKKTPKSQQYQQIIQSNKICIKSTKSTSYWSSSPVVEAVGLLFANSLFSLHHHSILHIIVTVSNDDLSIRDMLPYHQQCVCIPPSTKRARAVEARPARGTRLADTSDVQLFIVRASLGHEMTANTHSQ